jgi:protein TonB
MSEPNRGLRPSQGHARLGAVPAGLAVIGHVLLLGLAARLMLPALPVAPEPGGFPLILEQVDRLAPAAVPLPAPHQRTLTLPAAMVIEGAAPAPVPRPAPRAPRAHRAAPSTPPAWHPAAAQAAAAVPSGPAMIAGGPGDDNLLQGLEGRIDAAVRQAAIMPQAAQRQHRQGRAQIGFTYRDGNVAAARIVASSQSPVLDNAALRAVREASYPPPPARLRGRMLNLVVWIDFRTASAAS